MGAEVSRRRGKENMNARTEDTATKILLAFESGGIVPLPPEKFAEVGEHVPGILGRAMRERGREEI